MKTLPWVVVACSMVVSPVLLAAKSERIGTIPPFSAPERTADFANVTPVCLDRSEIPQEELHWLYIPRDPGELATSEDYAYLSGQLIQTGAIDASDCPLGGLWPNGYANACGLAKTRQVSLYLQNVYDDEILAAGKSIGVPPVMMKQQIRYESQFWPVRRGVYHFGLGQLTYSGASMALLWNRALYEATLAESQSTVNMPSQLLSIMDATCPTCSLKVDIPKAERSVFFMAQVLLAYCKETAQVVYNATQESPGDVVDYATIWRLTLLNYNAGPYCVYDAVKANHTYGTKLSWSEIDDNVAERGCAIGAAYADKITAPYYDFGSP